MVSEADRPQPGVYRVTLSTGLIRGAGTDANVDNETATHTHILADPGSKLDAVKDESARFCRSPELQ